VSDLDSQTRQRLKRLLAMAAAEQRYLERSDQRLFAQPVTVGRLANLPQEDQLSETVDAFVARFSRFQDTLGDKILPAFLRAMGETPGAMLENLDRAEKLGLIASADQWMAARKLRNRMIHEYVDDMEELAQALEAAHGYLSMLKEARQRLQDRLSTHFPELGEK
jgi:hypothetical protein